MDDSRNEGEQSEEAGFSQRCGEGIQVTGGGLRSGDERFFWMRGSGS